MRRFGQGFTDGYEIARQRARSARIVRAAYASLALGMATVALVLKFLPSWLGVPHPLSDDIAMAFSLIGLGNLLALAAWEFLFRRSGAEFDAH